MEQNIFVFKFSRLIERIVEEKFELSSYDAERLLNHLQDKKCNAVQILLSMPMFSDLIFRSIDNMDSISSQNRIFIIDVLTVLFNNELQFDRLQNHGVQLCMIKNYVQTNTESPNPVVEFHYACVKLAIAQLSHSSGLKMILICKKWEVVMSPNVYQMPSKVTKLVYEFMSKLMWKLDDFEEEAALNEVLEFIVQPIKVSGYQTLIEFDIDSEKQLSDTVITTLNILRLVFDDSVRLIKSKYLFHSMKTMFFVHSPLHKIFISSRDHTIICLINDILLRFYFASSARNVSTTKTKSDSLNEFLVKFLNHFANLLIEKRMISSVMDFVTKSIIFWFKTGSTLLSSTFERNGKEYQIEDQFLILSVLPLMTYTVNTYKETYNVLERYNTMMATSVTEHVFKSYYNYKTIIEDKDLKKTAIQATKELLKLKGFVKPKQACLMFLSLYNGLDTYVQSHDEDRVFKDNPLETSEDVKLLSLLLDGIKMMLMEHVVMRGYCNKSIQIISLQNTLLNLLKQILLPAKQILQVFDLIDFSFKKFLSTEMPLLVEHKQGNHLDEIAAIMKSYMQHEEWEVRDSALSLLLSCTDIAYVKYVPLRNVISENGLVVLAAHAAFNDPEYYVQATALQCLAVATKIDSIWQEVTTAYKHLYKQLLFLLKNHPEGLIRREIAEVLTQVYTHQKTYPQFEKYLFNFMSSAALNDLHWEVQIKALYFWKPVIYKLLCNKGMVDGQFPKVIFSKEKRKILVMDEKEVKTQLACVLKELSDIGCLTVLYECLNEDVDTEVLVHATSMSKKLVEVLDSHGFDNCLDISNETMDDPMDFVVKDDDKGDMVLDLSFVLDIESRSDQVIDEIVSTKLEDLIMNMYGNPLMLNAYNDDILLPLCPVRKPKVHPNTFLAKFRQTDFDKLIKMKKDWTVDNQTLDALLDEILSR